MTSASDDLPAGDAGDPMRVHCRVPPSSYRERLGVGRRLPSGSRRHWSGWNRFQEHGRRDYASSWGKSRRTTLDFRRPRRQKVRSAWKRFRNHRPGSPTSRRGPASGSPPSRASSTTAGTSPRRRGSGCSRRSARSSTGRARSPRTSRCKRTLVIGVVLPFLTEASADRARPRRRDGARVVAVRPRALRRRVGGPPAARVPPARRRPPHRRPAGRLADPARRGGATAARRVDPVRAHRRAARRAAERRDRRRRRGRARDAASARARAPPHRVHRRQAGRSLPLPVEPRPDDRVRARARVGRDPDPARVRPRGNAEPPRRAQHRGRAAAAPGAADGGVRRLGRPGARRARSGARPRHRRARSSCR